MAFPSERLEFLRYLQWRKEVAQKTGLGFALSVGQLGQLSVEENVLEVSA
jgi:hypothetical protein